MIWKKQKDQVAWTPPLPGSQEAATLEHCGVVAVVLLGVKAVPPPPQPHQTLLLWPLIGLGSRWSRQGTLGRGKVQGKG